MWIQVRKRPLNKKEVSRKEEDIISIESNSNSLVVHETKLKVSIWDNPEKHILLLNYSAFLNFVMQILILLVGRVSGYEEVEPCSLLKKCI